MNHPREKNDLPFELRLVLDHADRRYTPGAPITGTIEVRVLKACQCRALRLRLVWETHGRGPSQRGMFAPVLLFAGAWQVDRLLRYPFRLEAPFAPPSYEGKYLSMDWYLRAQADVSHSLGSRRYEVEEKLTLLPDAEEPPGTEGSPRQQSAPDAWVRGALSSRAGGAARGAARIHQVGESQVPEMSCQPHLSAS